MKRLASEWTLAWLLVGLGALGGTAACDDTDEPGGSGGTAGSAGSSSGHGGSAQAGTASSGTHSGGKSAGGSANGGTPSGGTPSGGTAPTGGTDAMAGEAGQSQGGVTGEAGGGAGGDDTAGAGGEAPCVPGAPTPPTNVPDIISAPEGSTLLRHFHAVGTQNYVCTKGEADAYSWVFAAPVAELSNSCGVVVGHHFAAPNTAPPVPVWKYDADGSSVKGKRLQAAPVNGAIPELLLEEDGHDGAGLFQNVTFVQRLRTAGGLGPAADTCNAQHENEGQDVPYTAEYYFYTGGD